MTKFIIVRHGQTEWNLAGRYQGQSDIALTDAGIKQAEILAENFPEKNIAAIYSSDLSRAFVTAGKIADKLGCELHKDKAFREICFGDWEGHTYEEIIARWPEELVNFFQRPDILKIPNGETFADVQNRAVGRMMELAGEYPDKTVVIVAHGAVIRTMLAAAVHSPLRYLWSFRQDNTALSIVLYNSDGFLLQLANSTEHLRGTEYQVLTKI